MGRQRITVELYEEAERGLGMMDLDLCESRTMDINIILAACQDEEVREVITDWINCHQKLFRYYKGQSHWHLERECAENEAYEIELMMENDEVESVECA